MAGNVWEWTGSLWGKDWEEPDFGYPYDPADGREDTSAPDTVRRVLRGGSFYYFGDDVRCAVRDGFSPDIWYDYDSVRVVVSPGS